MEIPNYNMTTIPQFVGRDTDHGWKLAETLTPLAYIGWSVWLIAVGIAMLV